MSFGESMEAHRAVELGGEASQRQGGAGGNTAAVCGQGRGRTRRPPTILNKSPNEHTGMLSIMQRTGMTRSCLLSSLLARRGTTAHGGRAHRR